MAFAASLAAALGCGGSPQPATPRASQELPAAPLGACLSEAEQAIADAEKDSLWNSACGGKGKRCLQGCRDDDAASCTKLSLPFGSAGRFACARALRERACAGGDPDGCAWLARLYTAGDGVKPDEARARRFAARACEKRSALGCVVLGTIEDDARRGAALFRKGCELGSAQGCAALGASMIAGDGVPRDAARGAALLDRACGERFAPACTELGRLYLSGTGVRRDPSNALLLFDQACQQGSGEGCVMAAGCYASGCTGKDPARHTAVVRLARGCDLGHGDACAHLAAEIVNDPGPVTDYEAAAAAASRGCELGSPLGCHLLGHAALEGKGVVGDPREAARLFQRACGAGFAEGCAALVWNSWKERILGADARRALAALRALCDREGEGCVSLALFERYGIGGAADPDGASARMRKRCEAGDPRACSRLAWFHLEQGRVEEALHSVEQGIGAKPDHAWLWMTKGVSKAVGGEYRDALAAFERLHALQEDDQLKLFSAIWIHHASTRLFRPDSAPLEEAMKRWNDWPRPIAEHRLGKRDDDALVAAAEAAERPDQRKEWRCEAYFFIGLRALERGRRDEAIRWFQRSAATEQFDFFEHMASRAWLETLGAAPAGGKP